MGNRVCWIVWAVVVAVAAGGKQGVSCVMASILNIHLQINNRVSEAQRPGVPEGMFNNWSGLSLTRWQQSACVIADLVGIE